MRGSGERGRPRRCSSAAAAIVQVFASSATEPMVMEVLGARRRTPGISVTQSGDGKREARDLEARVDSLEEQVVTLAAAVDAASRMRISTPLRINYDIRIAGGKAVRRILEKGGLVDGYPEAPGTE